MIKSLGVKRQSKSVMPNDFYQITPTPPEDEKIARMRVAPETFLDLQRQSVHAATHVAHTTRQPDANTGRNRDHRPPSAATTRRSVRPSTCKLRVKVATRPCTGANVSLRNRSSPWTTASVIVPCQARSPASQSHCCVHGRG